MSTHSDPQRVALQAASRREKIQQARAVPVGDRLMAGAHLFDAVRERIKAGIRARQPEWTAEQVHQEFLAQLTRQRKQAERGIYRVIGYLNDDGTMTPVSDTDPEAHEQ